MLLLTSISVANFTQQDHAIMHMGLVHQMVYVFSVHASIFRPVYQCIHNTGANKELTVQWYLAVKPATYESQVYCSTKYTNVQPKLQY